MHGGGGILRYTSTCVHDTIHSSKIRSRRKSMSKNLSRPLANKTFSILRHQDEQKLQNNVMCAEKEW